eukprot:TRINITY_DN9561_c0_g1_i1.p1 TRINITY_DN9561_c0_g1~~TRINITY_DN9561_c0_g1_i1.p1  ORF type:complete len:150 (+),score=61.39 TRINITY_DN9561_c0_g1_i1:48-452(+)
MGKSEATADMETINIVLKGNEFHLHVAVSATIQDLKEAIGDKMGVDPDDQELYFFGFPLTEPEMQITDFLEMSKTFTLVLPEEDDDKCFIIFERSPRGFTSDKEILLITGGRFNFKTILLKANTKEWIKLKSKS